jgi:predicted transcriptional regulator
LAKKRDGRQPTPAELEILQVLWETGPATVRDVFLTLSERAGTGYTTVLKLMQIMAEKGLLKCNKKVRPQVYRTAQTKQKTQRQLIGDLLDRAFSGSPGKLVLQALSSRRATSEERQQIRELLDKLERDGK